MVTNPGQLFNGTFNGKTVLITGHTGFKGAWLSLWLRELGANVIGYSIDPPTRPNLFEQCGLTKKVNSVFGDIRNLDKLRDVIENVKPEIIFHLAAQPLVRQSYIDPIETITSNTLGTVQLLEAIRLNSSSVRVCQVITSDKCYENEENDQARSETDKLGGRDPYSASKACAEILVSAYRNSFFNSSATRHRKISISSVRAGNVIGGGDWGKDRLIPDCIRALSKGESIAIRNPKATRPWQYILDVLSGYLRLAEQQLSSSADLYAGAWNFGPEVSEGLTVENLTEQIIKAWGNGRWVIQKPSTGFVSYEAPFLKLDSTKARELIGWRHVYSLEQSIGETVNWYHNAKNLKPGEVYAYTVAQIDRYVTIAKGQHQLWTLQEKVLQ